MNLLRLLRVAGMLAGALTRVVRAQPAHRQNIIEEERENHGNNLMDNKGNEDANLLSNPPETVCRIFPWIKPEYCASNFAWFCPERGNEKPFSEYCQTSAAPSPFPSSIPSSIPSIAPTASVVPTLTSSSTPSLSTSPSEVLTTSPSEVPTLSSVPSRMPSVPPTLTSSSTPSLSTSPSEVPTLSSVPSKMPSVPPTLTSFPSKLRSLSPSSNPSLSAAPSDMPSRCNRVVTSLSDSGPGSLRQALAEDCGQITFDNTIASQTIQLTTGELIIDKDVGIQGPITIDAQGNSRIFRITSGDSVSITSVAMMAGEIVSGNGGCIQSQAQSLILVDVVLTGCVAQTGDGGALQATGSVEMVNSRMSDNLAAGNGGAVHTTSVLQIAESSFERNSANMGGAIFIQDPTISATGMFASTLNNNTAINGGAAVHMATSQLSILLSTLSGNVGPSALEVTAMFSTTTILSSTISGNTGSAIGISGPSSSIVAFSTIIDGPCSATGMSSQVQLFSDNLVSDPGCCFGSCGVMGNLNAPAMLGPLADNGGPTLTHLPLPGSPVIDAGNNNGSFSTDQRGTGFDRIVNGAADIGSVELQSP